VSAPDHSVSESDVIEIECEVLYASKWWIPVIQCFPETRAEVVSTNNVSSLGSVNATLMYRKTVDVTSRLNNVEFDCRVVSSRSTPNIISTNTPADIHMWTSPALNVKCKLKPLEKNRAEIVIP